MTSSSKHLFTTPSKGGSGKSTAARFLVACLRERKANPHPLDPDDEIKAIRRWIDRGYRKGRWEGSCFIGKVKKERSELLKWKER